MGTFKKRDIKDLDGKKVEKVDLSSVSSELMFLTNDVRNKGQTFLEEDFAAAILGAAAHFQGLDEAGTGFRYAGYGLETGFQVTQLTRKS